MAFISNYAKILSYEKDTKNLTVIVTKLYSKLSVRHKPYGQIDPRKN